MGMTQDNHEDPNQQSKDNSEAYGAENIQNADDRSETNASPESEKNEKSKISEPQESVNPSVPPLAKEDEATETEMRAVEDFDLNLLLDIPLEISVELGRARIQIQELLNMGPGSTVTLSKLEGEPVDILANDKLIARGEVVLQNKKYGIRITEITSRMDRIKSLN